MKINYSIRQISFCLWIFLVGISCYIILEDANWILGDDLQFLSPIMHGYYISSPIFPNLGRFFPLSFQEFNILRFFSLNDPFWYYCISCLEFVVTVLFFTLFLKELSNKYKNNISYFLCVFFFALFILSKSVLFVYMDVIFPERNVLLCLSLFMFFYWRGIYRESLFCVCIAAFFAVMSFYYKEPVFGLFLVFCVCPFVFDYKNVSKYHKIFTLIIFINIILYLFLYYHLVYQYLVKAYSEGRVAATYFENFYIVLKRNRFFIAVFLFACFRFFRIVIFHEKKYLVTDSLLFSSIAYFFAFIILKLNAMYYFVPVYILALPSFFTFVNSLRNKIVILLICSLFAGNCYSFSSFKREINSVHVARVTDMKQIDFLSEKVKAGYEIFYLQVKNNNPENAFDNVLMNYWHYVLGFFLDYHLGYEYKIKVVDELFPLSEKQILISSDLVVKEKEIDFSKLGNVTSFQMNHNALTVYERNND